VCPTGYLYFGARERVYTIIKYTRNMPEGFLGKLQSAPGKGTDWKMVEEGGRILTLVPTVYKQEYAE